MEAQRAQAERVGGPASGRLREWENNTGRPGEWMSNDKVQQVGSTIGRLGE